MPNKIPVGAKKSPLKGKSASGTMGVSTGQSPNSPS
ncbi:MAG: hypothetical protein K0R67_1228, partial [Paenibacillus sp.]|nr:hypothetical protein [Paenibacillus sp.]